MANPTTNYGFVLPTPTDLVTDLPADFEVALQGVDTQMKTNADAATQKATLTTKGDIYAATGTSTPARLAVGANDTVLIADSSTATGLKWGTVQAGGMTLISTTTLSGASVVLSSIPSTYKNLQLVIKNLLPVDAGAYFYMRLNGDTGTRYAGYEWAAGSDLSGTFGGTFLGTMQTQMSNSVSPNIVMINLWDYANTTTWKSGTTQGANALNGTPANIVRNTSHFYYNQTAAISSITLFMSTGNITSGTALLYGVS
jgi:hypothetical protein